MSTRVSSRFYFAIYNDLIASDAFGKELLSLDAAQSEIRRTLLHFVADCVRDKQAA